MIYEEFAPSAALSPFVDRFWSLDSDEPGGAADAILPDGHAEIIVHAADPFLRWRAGEAERQDAVLVSGQLTRAIHVAPSGVSRVVGARLRPGGLYRLLGCPQHEVTDHVTALSGLHAPLARRIRDDVCARIDRRARVAALDRALCGLVPRARAWSPADAAIDLAVGHRGLVRVGDLARRTGVSPRQIERAFRDRVGIPPKLFLRILRFQEVLGAVRSGATRGGWAGIAAEHGFYDQAHFVNDFKTFTGASPTAWQVSDESLTAVFSGRTRKL